MTKQERMSIIEQAVLNLRHPSLYQYRVENSYIPVIGEGSLDARIMLIGEAPGKKEALTGKPFCGASGKVLDQLLERIKLKREDVYITSIIKDRPQDNRDPKPDEISLYGPFLISQIEIIQPQVVATLGRFSMEYVLNHYGLTSQIDTISNIHGKVFEVQTAWGQMSIVPLYHPAYAIYNRSKLEQLQKDFEILLGRSGTAPTGVNMI
jgi:DNA polymerase